jgi:ABC-type branched-subunit amino acid transport system permease subunit
MLIVGGIGTLVGVVGGLMQVWCTTLACVYVQEICLIVGEFCFASIFAWLMLVTYHKKSTIRKLLEPDKGGADSSSAAIEKKDETI